MGSDTLIRSTDATKIAPLFPFLDLKAQFEEIREEIVGAILRTMQSQRFILGPEVEALETEVAKYIGCPFAVACASGSDALLLALMALEIGPGDEVITTPFTFVATAGCIARLGATPVFVDIDPATYNLDSQQLSRALTEKTRAILPVHLYGLPASMNAIQRIAQANNLPIVEDAAQALGAVCDGVRVGNIGTFGCFSFFPSKNLGCAGDGGMITTNDAALADRVRSMRVHGSRQKYHCEILGINSRLDALQAAILRAKLPHLETWTESRRRNAARYASMFKDTGLDRCIVLPIEPEGTRHVYNQFVIRVSARDELRHHLHTVGIPTEIYYPEPLHIQPAFRSLGYKPGDLPNAEAASRQALALPIYPELTEKQQTEVVHAIDQFYNH